MKWVQDLFKESARDFFIFVRQHFLLLALVQVLMEFPNLVLDILSGQSTEPRWEIAVIHMFWTVIIELVFLSLIAPLFKADKEGQVFHYRQHLRRYGRDLTAEYVRYMGITFIGFLLLILPAIYFSVIFIFVPYIALFDPNYEKGEVNALERSREMTRGRLFPLFLCICFSAFITQIWDFLKIYGNPALYALALLLTLMARVYTQIFWFKAYNLLGGKT